MTNLQRDYYHRLRREWSQRWWYTARRAYDLARNAKLFSVSRVEFYQRVGLG